MAYQQVFPDHSANNHFVTLTNSKLSVDGTKFTYTLDKRTLVPKFLGPLLFSVTATTQNSMYQSDEVLYTPSDNGEWRDKCTVVVTGAPVTVSYYNASLGFSGWLVVNSSFSSHAIDIKLSNPSSVAPTECPKGGWCFVLGLSSRIQRNCTIRHT